MEVESYLRFLAALAAVLALLLAGAWCLRRFGPGTGLVPRGGRRLAVVESLSLDPRRRLLLVRRDGVEHLLLLGPGGECVVERGIVPLRQPAPGVSAPGAGPAESGRGRAP